ncbi:hypothetical protein ILUMI_20912 [Ignelater luminosus]|uniref:Peptidase S1 domain-containing protein n=1 Tax=Ignelater luminosus TaxID=2038154 RepID=A0A8K0CGK5_IGNLU|nr:hypothetical protein ILUMI_20912 [Ignelater luminosus]
MCCICDRRVENFKMWIYLAAFVGALVVSCNAQARSPCPGLFQYVSHEPGQWVADVTLASEADLHGVWVRLILDAPSSELNVTDNFGEVVTVDHLEYLLKNRDFLLKAGEPVKARIFVKYDGDKAPKLIGFRLNARTVCPEHGGEFNWVEENGQISKEYFFGDLNNKDFLNSRPTARAVTGCGTVPLFPAGSSSGKNEAEGQWPWHASIYLTKGNAQKSICSATLISPTHLLTAAHCVTPKNSEIPLNSDILRIRVGEHFTKSENKGVQEAHVIDVIVHSGYNAINFHNDVAIIRLDKAVTITDYVRPACLWEESPEVQAVLRREGIVAGLGFDNEGRYTERLTQAKVKVAARDVCLNSKPHLAPFLSENGLCAVYEKANTICVGESGSGFTVLSDTPKPVWQLRGLISVGAGLQNNLVCNESNYIVLTDLAKYLNWIKATLA